MTLIGWALIAGFVTFLVGAAGWRLEYQQEMKEALVVMHADRRRLRWIHWWMVPAMFLTTGGLVGLAVATGDGVVGIAAGAFAMGATLWLAHLLFRLSVGEWAAERTATTGVVPEVYEPLARWVGYGHAVHMVSAYVAAALLGIAALDLGLTATWLGWALVGWGVALTVLFLIPATQGGTSPPIMAHVATLAVGIALLV
jgi:hypothetical protein